MAVALVSHAIAHGVDGATTAGIDTTGASLLVLVVSDFTGGPGVTISDSKSNTPWNSLTAYTQSAGQMRVRLYYAWNPTVGSGHTFTSAGTGVYTNIAAAAFSGIKTSSNPYNGDVTGISDFTTSTSNPMSPGSVTVAAGDLCITGEGTPFGSATTIWTIDAGFTIADQYHSSGVTEGGGLAYFINSGGSVSKNPGWDPDISAVVGAATIATFAAAASSGVTLTPAQAAAVLSGKGVSMGFTINMPDEA